MAVVIALVLALGPLAGLTGDLQPGTRPGPDPRTLPTVTGQPLATWQTNGVVYAVETVGNIVYAEATSAAVRPPGAAAGQKEVARRTSRPSTRPPATSCPSPTRSASPNYPIPQRRQLDQTCSPGTQAGTYTCDTVYEIRGSRDGSKIYVGGDFPQVDGQARGNLAAFDTGNNALLSWRVERHRRAGCGPWPSATTPSTSAVVLGGRRPAAQPAGSGRRDDRAPCCPGHRPADESDPDHGAARATTVGSSWAASSTTSTASAIHGIAAVVVG